MTAPDLADIPRALGLARAVLQALASLPGCEACADYAGDLDELAAVVWRARHECGTVLELTGADLSFEKPEVVSFPVALQNDSAESRTFV